MLVLGASALLAFLQGEPGYERVEEALPQGVVGVANQSEVIQKLLSRGADVSLATSLLFSCGVQICEVTEADAEQAARLWHLDSGFSLGNRLCLVLGQRLDAAVLTADKAWGNATGAEQIRQPRPPLFVSAT